MAETATGLFRLLYPVTRLKIHLLRQLMPLHFQFFNQPPLHQDNAYFSPRTRGIPKRCLSWSSLIRPTRGAEPPQHGTDLGHRLEAQVLPLAPKVFRIRAPAIPHWYQEPSAIQPKNPMILLAPHTCAASRFRHCPSHWCGPTGQPICGPGPDFCGPCRRQRH